MIGFMGHKTGGYGSQQYVCRVEHSIGGDRFVCKAQDGSWRALVWVQEDRQWKTNSDTGNVAVPFAVWAEMDRSLSGQRLHENVKDLFPQSTSALREIENVFNNYTFQDKTLLAEALTHSSVSSQSITQSCERLAFVGDAAIRAVAGELFKRHACFATAATVREESFVATTFAVPRELPWPQDKDPEEDMSCRSDKEMERRLIGCCNNVAYARTCVRHNIHSFLRHNSEPLQNSISEFELAVRNNNASWEQLLQIGAPKALGDVFLACIGAVIIDDQLDKVRPVIKQHVEDCCAFFFFPELPQSVEHLKASGLEDNGILQALSQVSTTCMQKLALAPRPPPTDVDREMGSELQHDAYKIFTDLHIVKVNGVLACSSSPRTAQLSAQTCTCPPFIAPCGDLESPDLQQETPESKEGAVYCEDCEMWLNGPTQWEDHKIGKKHKKNLARTHPMTKTKAKCKPHSKPPPGPPEHSERYEEDDDDSVDDDQDDKIIKQVPNQQHPQYYYSMPPQTPSYYDDCELTPAYQWWMNFGGSEWAACHPTW